MDNKERIVSSGMPSNEDPIYCVFNSYGWGPDFEGDYALDDSGADHAGISGIPITKIYAYAKNIRKIRIQTYRRRWSEYKTLTSVDNPLGTDDVPITGIEIVGAGYRCAVHVKGGSWLTPVDTSDVEGEKLIGNNNPIDAIWIVKV